MKATLLIVDDEKFILEAVELALKERFEIVTASNVEAAQALLEVSGIDLIVTDLGFAGQELDGLDLINWLSQRRSEIPVIILSGDKDTQRVVSAQRRTQDDFIVKPFELNELIVSIEKALIRVKSKPEKGALREIITQDSRILEVMKDLKRVTESGSNLCVCLYGEPGTGKEELAKYVASVRGGPFIALNMAAIPTNLVESELFGHKKGSFTGAHADQIGKFQAARGGTIFLDEIGDCPPEVQVKLLRVLQEREVVRVGSNQAEKIDVKVVVATNKNLKELSDLGLFRNDLLDRIEGFPVFIPPLRARKGDIPLLVAKFLNDLCPKTRPATITAEALSQLQEYRWPGNIRELRTTLERSLVLSGLQEIDVQHLALEISSPVVDQQDQDSTQDASNNEVNLDEQLDQFERRLFKKALELAGGSRKDAIRRLGITESRFFRRTKALKLSPEQT